MKGASDQIRPCWQRTFLYTGARWVSWGLQSAIWSRSQPAKQPVSKLISQAATHTLETSAAPCVAPGSVGFALTLPYSNKMLRTVLSCWSLLAASILFPPEHIAQWNSGGATTLYEWNVIKLGLYNDTSQQQIKTHNQIPNITSNTAFSEWQVQSLTVWYCVYLSFSKCTAFSLQVVTFHMWA